MAQSSTIFISASDARQNPIRETVVHDEARAIESAILSAVKLGFFDCTVSDGTPMTESSPAPSEVWTVDPSTGIFYVPNHGLSTGDCVTLSSTGTLPGPLTNTAYYYVIFVDYDHIKLATSFANAVSGMPVSISITSSVNSITLTNQGSGYLQAPAVNFSGGNPTTTAAATAYLASYGSLVAINNTTSGGGYTDLPTVQIVPTGTGAVAGAITFACVSATIAATGQNYRIGDLLSVIGGVGTPTTIQVTDVNNTGAILAVAVANSGAYNTLPSVVAATTTVSPGGGTGCTVNLSFGIKSIAISNAGTNYVSPPKIVINSTTGTGATATATLYGGSVNEIIITNAGYGYLDVSGVDFDTGSGASATVMLQPTGVGNITLTFDGGSTYTQTPAVSIDTQGSGASAGLITMTVVNVQLVSPGANYQAGDSLLVSGGTASRNAWIKVQTVDTFGGILTYTLEDGGAFTALPGTVNNPVIGGSGTLAAFNLLMGVSSINVQTAGSGYVVPPVVTISSPSSTGQTAMARATLNAGSVDGFVIEKTGYGYTSIPTVTLSNGTGATGEAFLIPTTLNSVSMISPGTGYTYATVTASGGGASVDATLLANIVGGQITSIDVLTPGVGYTGTPTITIVGNGNGAQTSAVLTATPLANIIVTNSGSGYNVPPKVTIDGLATAVSLLNGTGVDNIVVDNIGDNYVSDPIIYLIPGTYQPITPIPPVLVPIRAYSVASISLTDTGQGYSSVPSVTLSAPFFAVGTTATAVATIGTGTGTFVLNPYYSSRDYFAAWKGLALTNSQLSRPYNERMDTIISYFTNLGYTINRLTNPATNNTLMWSVQW
jgi:hypothetical protein